MSWSENGGNSEGEGVSKEMCEEEKYSFKSKEKEKQKKC